MVTHTLWILQAKTVYYLPDISIQLYMYVRACVCIWMTHRVYAACSLSSLIAKIQFCVALHSKYMAMDFVLQSLLALVLLLHFLPLFACWAQCLLNVLASFLDLFFSAYAPHLRELSKKQPSKSKSKAAFAKLCLFCQNSNESLLQKTLGTVHMRFQNSATDYFLSNQFIIALLILSAPWKVGCQGIFISFHFRPA